MYDQSYDDYLRRALGIGTNYNNFYGNYNMNGYYLNNMQTTTSNTYGMSREQIEAFFPDIYRIINPLVVRTWNINTKPITNELIEQIAERIYDTVNDHREVRLNINLTNAVVENRNSEDDNKEASVEVRHSSEDSQTNYLLMDLIRILIVKDLMERQNFKYF